MFHGIRRLLPQQAQRVNCFELNGMVQVTREKEWCGKLQTTSKLAKRLKKQH